MINEIFQDRVVANYERLVEIINLYFGNNYKNIFEERGSKTSIFLVKNKGVVEIKDGCVYIGQEPVCIKENDGFKIIMPINFLEDKHGNVTFAHLVLHTLFNDCLSYKYKELNEVIVDYIADDIAKIMEKQNINVTLEDSPFYDSGSMYSKCFDIVSDYIEDNKRLLVETLVNGDIGELEEIEELAMLVEQRINSFAFEDVPENKFKK